VIIEHWYDDESTHATIKGTVQDWLFVGQPLKCCEIEGDSWEDCMKKYHEHMEWEPYVPMDINATRSMEKPDGH
jgi:hypothetical protein